MKCPNCQSEIPDEEEFCPECGGSCLELAPQQETHVGLLSPGTLLNDRYEIKEVLQAGTINLYRGSCEEKSVLIKEKTLAREELGRSGTGFTGDLGSLTLPLKVEFELLEALGFPEFQKVYEHFTVADREYLVLEYPEGVSLSSVVSEGPVGESFAIDVVVQLCDRAQRIHRLNYVHLNIEPETILLCEGRVKLLNFERSVKIGAQRGEHLTADGYSAPEVLVAGNRAVDPRADIYSIGAVLYRMLCGKVLTFTGTSASDVLALVSHPELARVLLSSLAPDPNLRYSNAEDLKQELLAYKLTMKRSLLFDSAVLTDRGMVRQNNEDRGLIIEASQTTDSGEQSYAIYLVADGMGGERAGEVASAKASEIVSTVILDNLKGPRNFLSFDQLLKSAIQKANEEIYVMARDNPAFSNMGTTATLGLRVNDELYLAHVGDSRAYLIRATQIRQLTQDHSLIANLIKAGMISPDEAKSHPDRGKIFRSLGNAPSVIVDSYRDADEADKLILEGGDNLLFCTDGLVNYVSDHEILSVVGESRSAYDACSRLICLANKRGGDDNITVIVVRISTVRQGGP